MPLYSDDEKKLFHSNGWEYDYIKREWVSPSGKVVSNEDLMKYTVTKEGEDFLRAYVYKHGDKSGV